MLIWRLLWLRSRPLRVCALILPDLLIFGKLTCPMEQNVLYSLLFALLALVCCDLFSDRPVQSWIISITLAASSMALRLSYGWLTVALCLCFYYAREHRLQQLLLTSLVLALYTFSLLLSSVNSVWVMTSLCAFLSLPFIYSYNGKPGLRHPWIGFAFYASYPAHLLLLVWLRMLRIVPPYFL